jgi:hypothetical protein
VGQYHRLVNIDKQEWVDPHGLGLGSKQYEQTGCDASLADAMYVLVMTSPDSGGGDFPMTDISGRWVGDRVLIVGDYTDKDAVPGFVGADAIYQLAEAQYKDITPDVRKALSKVFRIEYSTTTMGNHTFWNRVLE